MHCLLLFLSLLFSSEVHVETPLHLHIVGFSDRLGSVCTVLVQNLLVVMRVARVTVRNE